MDPQIFWDSVGSQSLEDFLLPPNGTNMTFANATTQESASMDIWNSGASSSTQPPNTEGNRDDPKMENGYTASVSSNRGGALRIGGRRTEPVNTLTLGSPNIDIWNSGAPISSQLPHTEVNCDETKMETGGGILRIGGRRSEPVNTLYFGSASIDLNNHHIEDSQPSFQSFSPNDLPQNFDNIVGHVGTSSQVQDIGSSRTGPLSSGGSYNTRGNSSRGFGNYSGNSEGRSGGSSDGRRASKRKLNEGVSGQESARGSGSSNFSHQGENNTAVHSGPSHQNPNSSMNISRPSDFLSGLQPAEQLNSRTGTSTGVVATGSSSGTVSGNREGSQRYVRMRINPVNVNDTPSPNQWAHGNTTPISNVWSDNQSALHAHFQSLRSIPVVSGSSSQSALNIPVIPRLPRNAQLRNGAPSRRIGSSPSNPIIVGDRLVASREEGNSSSIPRSNPVEIPDLPPAPDVTQLPFPPIFGLPEGNASVPETVIPAPHIGLPPPPMFVLPARGTGRHVSFVPAPRSGTSSGVAPSLGTTASHQNPPLRYHRSLSEAIRRSLFNASSAAYQAANVASQPLTQTDMPQNIVRPSAVRVQERPQAPRQRDDVPAIPVSLQGFAAVREGRSRMITEIRNAIDLMRRGETVRIEDMFLFDHPFFHGGPDLLDRHRDMRLDVDRMSYEELLALEERIGNVSTGLSEETINKCLKQIPHVPSTDEASEEVEPCCICQEEYVDGDELGKLDCCHDFHASCIKQWLLQKNLCPICKTTALKSAGK